MKNRHNEYTRELNYLKNFGGNRYVVLARDGYRCVRCGITKDEHMEKYGRDISVDHIDGDRSNNQPSNLQTLCLRCHGKKDATKCYSDRSRLSSKFQGVSWNRQTNKWVAYYYWDQKRFHVGYFDDPQIAKEAREKLFQERMKNG